MDAARPDGDATVRFAAPLADFGRRDIAVVGGKAANLGELIRAGFAVPAGFALTTAAYRAHLWAGGAQREITALSSGRKRTGAAVRAAILAAEVPPVVADAIRDAYRELGGGAVSVRSSATAEDLAEAAFAGQQDTFLDVVGEAEVIAAVRQCWASLWSDRAVEYRLQRGFARQEVEIAVVLQRMASAEIAGVLFTANPVTGARGEAVLAASPGVGEAVVSGAVSPDHYVLDKRRRRLITYRRGVSAVPQPRRLVKAEAVELVRLGVAVERHFGAAQDIEWAIAAGRIYLLQSRPLTALPPPPAYQGAQPWSAMQRRLVGVTRQMVAELAPVRPYPIDDTTWCPALLAALGELFGALGLRVPTFQQICTREDGVIVWIEPSAPRPTPRLLLAPWVLAVNAIRHDPVHWREEPMIEQLSAAARRWEARDLRAMSWAELLRLLREALDQPVLGARGMRIRYLPRGAFAAAALVVIARLAGYPGALGCLLAGNRTLTTEANEAVERLAETVRADAALAARFAAETPSELVAALPEFPDFYDEFTAFLARYGHREAAALLVTLPTWKDAPQDVLALVKALAADPPGSASTVTEDAVRELVALPLLRSPAVRAAMLRLVAVARTLFQVREDTHFLATVSLPTVRRVIREFGRRLAEVGVLDGVEDVYHLRLGELTGLAGSWPPDAEAAARIHRIVSLRQEKRASLAGQPYVATPEHRAGLVGALVQGMGASAGIAEGTVRIVHGPAEFDRLHTGEILVAPYTTPAWTPLFRRAVAVITDTGGAASHAAIVAREYGIPAVMGTGDGTSRLVDGQRVRVDGRAGVVTALDDAAHPPSGGLAGHSRTDETDG